MTYPTKIATCCFCGSKAALTLDAGRHELACAQCGAPLHNLKQIPIPAPAKPASTAPALRRFPAKAAGLPGKQSERKIKKPKKRKNWISKTGKELFDAVEDLID